MLLHGALRTFNIYKVFKYSKTYKQRRKFLSSYLNKTPSNRLVIKQRIQEIFPIYITSEVLAFLFRVNKEKQKEMEK